MLLYLLLIIKLIIFYFETKVQFMPFLVLGIDNIFVSIFYLLFRRKEKKFRIAGFILYSIISLIMFTDVVYFSYFNRMPVISELGHAGNLGGVTDALKRLFNINNLILILDLPFTGYVYFKRYVDDFYDKLLTKIKIPKYIPVFIILFASLLVVAINNKSLDSASKLSLFSYHIRDIAESFKKENADEDIDVDALKKDEEYKNELTGVAKGKNFIHIQIESMNDFVINREYNGEEITPNLNKLIKEKGSIYAKNYIEMLGAGNTSDAEFVSLHSLYPTMRAQSYEAYVDNYLFGLPKIFKSLGYEVSAFHGYKRDFWMRDRAYPNIGFDKFYAEDSFNLDDIRGMGLSDKSFLNQSFDIIKNQKQPFYSFLITLTSHVPYEIGDYDGELTPEEKDKGTFFFNYINAVHYTDKALGEFIDKLKESGLYDNTVIAMYGDHHGITGVEKEAMIRVGEFIGKRFDFDELMNVPLIIHVPGYDENKTVESVRCQLDFSPTILNLFGIDKNKYLMFGRDVLDKNHPNVAFPEGYMRKGSFISDDYIFQMGRDGIYENGILTDRKTGEAAPLNDDVKKLYKQAIKEITLSNKILDTNSVGKIMNKEADFNNDYEKPSDALVVSTLDELEKGIRGGYKYFYTTLFKTKDDFYVSNKDAKNGNFKDVKEDYISLGDMIGRYKNYKFIVDTEDKKDFSLYIKSVLGNHDSLILRADNKDEFENMVYRKNGYNLLLNANSYSKEELTSIKMGMPDLLILGGDLDEFKDQTFREFDDKKEGELSIVSIDNEKFSTEEIKPNYFDMDFPIADSNEAQNLNDLKTRESDGFIPVKFVYDKKNDDIKIRFKDRSTITAEELLQVLKDRPTLKIDVTADDSHVEILRKFLSYEPPKDRIMVELISTGQVSFITKMGFTKIVFNLNANEKIEKEQTQIYLYR